ncbi:uncharacterized protein LOC107435315 isoform X2 [Ziziphus jujuba]|uniref:Uncharacterized protein LOC107435315 isoform X2 n=1 Tax=Ziziphus jujuba TaxID=326968 RepID=A0A6P4BST2_ZIZJJ|nr:uncharacterized protein LOC107435315 isoform X2 [Ziziphus jujuba]
MDVASKNSVCFYCHGLCNAYSFKRSCFLLFLFFLFTIGILGIASLIIVFIIKPQKPVFSLKTVRLDLYELNAHSGSTLFLSSVITLILNAQNHNKVGISYRPSRLHVYFEGLPIGTIRVPGFLQPPHSSNVTVPTRILFNCLNVTNILAVASMQNEPMKNKIQMRILGDVKAHLCAFHVTLFKIKVAVACDINIDIEKDIIKNIYNMRPGEKSHVPFSPTNLQSVFQKCSVDFYL